MIRVKATKGGGRAGSGPLPDRLYAEVPTMTTPRAFSSLAAVPLAPGLCAAAAGAGEAASIPHHGKVVTADRDSSTLQAPAVKGHSPPRAGTDDEVFKTRGQAIRFD